ncbi:MAG: 4-hydroxybenzoate octaprenyltransferase [Neptuniibacter sp.]
MFSTSRMNKLLSREKLNYFGQLMRVDKPIGTLLLLWPTYWALWIAAEGPPPLGILFIFTLGVFLTRSAGCVINDYADRKVDGHVKRTANRPIPSGHVSTKEALLLFTVLMLCAFILVLFTNQLTVLMSFGGLLLAACYPFMKRHTHLPQVVLGAAFAWGIPMAFTAVNDSLPAIAWLIFTLKLIWTVAYDTMYAMVDRDDDLRIGVKSTAVLFGEADKLIIGSLQVLTLLALILLGTQLQMSIVYYLGILGAAATFIHQQRLIQYRDRDDCFKAFLNNQYSGLAVFAGIVAHYFIQSL